MVTLAKTQELLETTKPTATKAIKALCDAGVLHEITGKQRDRIYAYQGAGHSVGLHTARPEQAMALALTLPVSRVIVDQAHCIATGGSFDNGLPFSLSMGCGTWGGNNFSDNMNYRHYLNITRISRPIAERVPTEDEIFGRFFSRYGKA